VKCRFKNILIENCAVAEKDGEVEYSLSAASDSFSICLGPRSTENTTRVKALSIQSLLNSHEIERVDFMKMDIEGEEVHILNQRADLAWLDNVDELNIEVHGQKGGTEKRDIVNVLVSRGFSVEDSTSHKASILARRL